MKSVITGLLWIQLEDLTTEHIEVLKASYRYSHPYEENSHFETFFEHKGKIGIPSGDIGKALMLLPKGIQIEDQRVSDCFSNPVVFTGPPLRDYQEDALKEILEYLKGGGTTFNLAGCPRRGQELHACLLTFTIKS